MAFDFISAKWMIYPEKIENTILVDISVRSH